MGDHAKSSSCLALRIMVECDLAQVRPAVAMMRDFLLQEGVLEDEVMACELALTEACNNAIQYAGEHRCEPIEIQALCNGSKVELRVHDHTPGFDWPARAEPPDPLQERGRGLFLIQSTMDRARYFRGQGENTLVMSKARRDQEPRSAISTPATLKEANRRLQECEMVVSDMAKELCFQSESLGAIFRCSAELGRTNNLEDFAHRLLNDLLHITSADWFVLRTLAPDELHLNVLTCSRPSLRLSSLELNQEAVAGSVELEAALSRQDVWFDQHHPLGEIDPLHSLAPESVGLVRPFFFGEKLVGTLSVGKTTGVRYLTAAQAEVVHTFADFIAIQIVNLELQQEHVTSRLMSHELEIARQIQRAFLPKNLPQLMGFGLAGSCESARQVSGDFYDVRQLSDHSLLLLVADVMGKGVPAAMFAAILRSLLRVIPVWTRQPSEMLSHMNRLLFEELSSVDMFITAQLVLVDTEKRKLIAANAGHCPVLLARRGDAEPRTIAPEGMPLGIMAQATFTDEVVALGNNCRLLLYTDGITEQRDAAGDFFGPQRLGNWLTQSAGKPVTAEQLKQQLAEQLAQFRAGRPRDDDQTFLILTEENTR